MKFSFRPIPLGINGDPGWLVLMNRRLIAVLQGDDDGGVLLASGLEYPWTDVYWSWKSLEGAKEHFLLVAKQGVVGDPTTRFEFLSGSE